MCPPTPSGFNNISFHKSLPITDRVDFPSNLAPIIFFLLLFLQWLLSSIRFKLAARSKSKIHDRLLFYRQQKLKFSLSSISNLMTCSVTIVSWVNRPLRRKDTVIVEFFWLVTEFRNLRASGVSASSRSFQTTKFSVRTKDVKARRKVSVRLNVNASPPFLIYRRHY